MNADKRILVVFGYVLFCWYSDLIIEGRWDISNAPLGATVVWLIFIPVIIRLFNGLARFVKAGRILLWFLLIPLSLANLPPGMDFYSAGPAWSYAVGGFRMGAFLIAFFLAKWLLIVDSGWAVRSTAKQI